jgi:hypothetical protein
LVRITEKYKITGPVPFLDVHVDRDNLLFIHPTAIRNGLEPQLSVPASARIESFTAEIIRCRESPQVADQIKGRSLLRSGLKEPNETRLGYTRYGSRGHGWGPGLGTQLWKALDSPLCQRGLLTSLEHLPLFVPRVGQDLISDMTTRLAMPELIEFTGRMVHQYPALRRDLRKTRLTVWDETSARWVTRDAELPYVSGKHLLLLPKSWVSKNLPMHPRQFYNRFTTDDVQLERARYIEGRALVPLKRDLHREFPDIHDFNTSQTLKAADKGTNLVRLYDKFADFEYCALPDDEILQRTAA